MYFYDFRAATNAVVGVIKNAEAKMLQLFQLSVNELKDLCRKHGLLVTGTKTMLIERLRAVDNI